MLEKIKKYRISILILSGIAFYLLYGLYIKIYRIPTVNNLAALIGIIFTFVPICIGVFLYGMKIRHYKKGWSILARAIRLCVIHYHHACDFDLGLYNETFI